MAGFADCDLATAAVFQDSAMTLLDNLCKLAGQQGGTIHQFFPQLGNFPGTHGAMLEFLKCDYNEAIKLRSNFEVGTRAEMDVLAGAYGLYVKWE